MSIEEIKEYLENKKTNFDSKVLEQLHEFKKAAIDRQDEVFANEVWVYEQTYEVQKKYIDFYNKLKDKDFFSAWRELDSIDIQISNIRENFNYSNNKYNLDFIENIIREFAKLFPYNYFLSREAIIKREKCSICQKIVTIRNQCDHIPGKIYMGEMCCREIEDIDFIGLAIVENPFDKYTVLFPQNMEYNYFMLEELMRSLDNPYDIWYVEIIKQKDPKYQNVQRNDICPCMSGKKYKKCCSGTEKEFFDHYRITFVNKPDMKQTPIIIGNTWKNNKLN